MNKLKNWVPAQHLTFYHNSWDLEAETKGKS